MNLLSQLKCWALNHALQNMDDEAITDLIVSYQKKEFGDKTKVAIGLTGDKLLRIGLSLKRRINL